MTEAEDSTGLLTPAHVQAAIEQQGIHARLIDQIGETPTVSDAAIALGVNPTQIIKTLLFLVEQRHLPERPIQPVIVISNGESRVAKRPLADYFGVGLKRIKLAPAERVEEILGYAAGGVPPFGHRSSLPVILDEAVLEAANIAAGLIYAGGGDDRTMMELTVDELLRITQPLILNIRSA